MSLYRTLLQKYILGTVVCWSICAPLAAHAQSPEEKGLAIARETDRRESGFGDTVAMLQMILKNAQGQESTRSLRIQTRETPENNDGDKIFMVFDAPRDINGTALLTYTHITQPDDQWLYLPALKRVKRIASSNQTGSFVGSEFTYEDLVSPEIAKYTHRYLRDEACGPLQCFVVERTPTSENSGYSRQVVWIDHTEYRLHKSEFYDRKQLLLKTLTFSNYQQYLKQYWRALSLDMHNHQTGKSTTLLFSEYRFRTGLSDDDFSLNALQRVQ